MHFSIDSTLIPSAVLLNKPCFALHRFSRSSTMSSFDDGDMNTFGPELPAMFDGMKLAALAAVLYIIVRGLNLKSTTGPPEVTYQDTPLSRYLLKSCPMLTTE